MADGGSLHHAMRWPNDSLAAPGGSCSILLQHPMPSMNMRDKKWQQQQRRRRQQQRRSRTHLLCGQVAHVLLLAQLVSLEGLGLACGGWQHAVGGRPSVTRTRAQRAGPSIATS